MCLTLLLDGFRIALHPEVEAKEMNSRLSLKVAKRVVL